jgi:hypothetical protein
VYRALIVCNHLYEARDPGLPPLRGPEADGEMLGRALVDPAFGFFNSSHVKVLQNASSLEIQEAASRFFSLAQPDDVLLFYFSGHGRKRSGKLYLCANNTHSDHLPATSVSNDTLNDIIDDSKARAKILILDCCYSGAFKGDEQTELLLWAEGRYVLMATSPVDVAPDATEAGQPSPFTKVLVEGLLHGAQDSNRNGHVNLRDIYRYLVEQLGPGVRPRQKYDGFGEVPIARRQLPDTPAPPAPAATPSEIGVADRAGLSFLDETTSDTDLSADRVAEFRRQLRSDVAQQMPELLSPREFLQRAQLMREGQLTRGGALLFGEDPTRVVPTALVQCTWFDGTERNALLREKFDLLGSVPEQIAGAYDFLARTAKQGEAPMPDSVIAQSVYGYPMLAAREIIANALVHRDYEHQQVCVHVRVFADRIEIANPGTWTGRQITDGKTTQLGDLRSESHRRNFTLAKVLAWMRMVEGEGAGIPRAIGDCHSVGAPEPTMIQLGGVVTVTIYPIADRLGNAMDPMVRRRDIDRLTSEFAALGAMADPSLRERVVAALPTEIRSAIPRHVQPRQDIASIVATAHDVAGGLRELLDATRDLEGNTRDTRRIGELIDAIAGSGSSSRIITLEAKNRVLRAVEEVGLWRNPSLRQAVVTELRHEIGAGFNPPRWSDASGDTWSIVSACVQMRRTDLLIAVLKLLVGETPALARLESLVDEIFSRTTTAGEHSQLDQLLRPVAGGELEEILGHQAFSGHRSEIPDDVADGFDVYEVLGSDARLHGALLAFLEVAAHTLEPDQGRELHAVLGELADRWQLRAHLAIHQSLEGRHAATALSSRADAPMFYLSYARGDDERLVERFYLDLCAEIRDRAGLGAQAQVGYLDVRDVEIGARWASQLSDALNNCRTFVALMSPRSSR